MTTDPAATIYQAVGGAPALLRLAHAWHERCLADPVAAHPFEHQLHPQHLERLAAYWGEALGGPPAYTDGLGDETRMRRMHAGNGEHPELDERAVDCFGEALGDADLPNDERLRASLLAYFRWATKQLAAYPDSPREVPRGLDVPHWSWDGLDPSATSSPAPPPGGPV